MKVAVCISGQPRFVEKGYSTIYPFLIENLDADVFIHSWYDKDKVGEYYTGSKWIKKNVGKVEEAIDEKILDLYKPVSYIIEPQKNFKVDHIRQDGMATGTDLNASFSMFYSIHEANRLRREYGEYDWVIRTRFDLLFMVPLEIDGRNPEVLHARRRNKIKEYNIIDDCFALGTPRIMDIYSDVYFHLEKYYNENNIIWSNEFMLTHHMLLNKIDFIDPNYPGVILRDGAEEFLLSE